VRFLADENVEQAVVQGLREAGHDVAYVAEVAAGASDAVVLRLAEQEARVLLTNDKDFGEMAYRQGRAAAGILLLRFQTQDGGQKAEHLRDILPGIESLLARRFAVLTERSVRIRMLREE